MQGDLELCAHCLQEVEEKLSAFLAASPNLVAIPGCGRPDRTDLAMSLLGESFGTAVTFDS